MNDSERWHRVCRLADIEDPGARGFDVEGRWPAYGFLVRKDDAVHAYVNTCPHAGRQLHWKPHAFLTRDKSLIMCSAHGAVFEMETGLCVAGPCPGERLRSMDVEVRERLVLVRLPD